VVRIHSVSIKFRLVSAPMSSLPSTPALPHELWREIFQLATFIPNESEISTTIRQGIFATGGGQQLSAWEIILPLRVAIQGVSRLWHSIGVELLYRSFHDGSADLVKARRFARALCTKLVKRGSPAPSYSTLVPYRSSEIAQMSAFSAQAFTPISSPIQIILTWMHSYFRGPFSISTYSVLSHLELFLAFSHLPNLKLLAIHGLRQLPPGLLSSQVFNSFGLDLMSVIRIAS